MSDLPSLEDRLRADHYTNADGYLVFTERHHLKRGSCCGCGCRHCPFEPQAIKGNERVQDQLVSQAR